MKPRLLDLFCGAGGAAMGYHRAGFEVVGVDIAPQPHYPFEFVQADALEYCNSVAGFDAIHASPPCQAYSWSAKRWNVERDDLVGATRELLQASGRPWVMENVVGAPLANPFRLCGEMFGLEVIRHRLFESDLLLFTPPHSRHRGTGERRNLPDGGRSWRQQRQGARRTSGETGGHGHRLDERRGTQPGHPACLHRVHRSPASRSHRACSMNHADLRAAAEAALNGEHLETVWFHDAASPDRILAILDELKRKTAALERLLGAATPLHGKVAPDFWDAMEQARAALEED